MEEEGEYERGLRLLESLITGKKRQDGSQWENAFQMMQCYLDVRDTRLSVCDPEREYEAWMGL